MAEKTHINNSKNILVINIILSEYKNERKHENGFNVLLVLCLYHFYVMYYLSTYICYKIFYIIMTEQENAPETHIFM